MKVFSLLIFQYQFDNDEVTGVWIMCTHCNKLVHFSLSETVTIDILPVFIKAIVFHHVGLSWMIETRYQYDFSVDKYFPCWCTIGPRYNTTMCKNLYGPISEDFFVTAHQYRYYIFLAYMHKIY